MPPKKVNVAKAPDAIKKAMIEARASSASPAAVNPFIQGSVPLFSSSSSSCSSAPPPPFSLFVSRLRSLGFFFFFFFCRAAKKSELDQLLNMTPKEIYPYACFLTLILLSLLYQMAPKILAPLVEFQYLVQDPDEEAESGIPKFGASSRSVVKFFEIGPLDAVHLVFIFLGVVSFNVFVNELWQMVMGGKKKTTVLE